MKTVAIVPAAGSGRRLRSRRKKPFALMGGKPLITYPLKALESSKCIDSIIVAVEAPFVNRLKGMIVRCGFKKVVAVVKGGLTRQESVRNCFKAITGPCDVVLIHDGARPFLEERIIKDSISLANRYGCSIAAIPVTDTIKTANVKMFVAKTLDRRCLWRAQTPQVFKYAVLKKALKIVKKTPDTITDDSMLAERIGKKIKILEGSARNIKITTKEDIKIAEALL